MQEGIHPKYTKCTVTCACGATFECESNTAKVSIGICSKCHPFFTGKQKLVDTEGRVDAFRRRYAGTRGASLANKDAAAPKK